MDKENSSNSAPGNDPKRSVTLRDIARELGISHVTVSLALRNHPRISDVTKKRVKAKAEEMGYHPDPMLSALSHYRLTSKEKPQQAALAWINPLQHPEKLRQFEEFNLYWKGASAMAKRFGFHLEEFKTTEFTLERMNTIFKTRSIRGVLIAPLSWQTSPINWDAFPWKDYAGVRFGRSQEGPLLHFVMSAQVSNTMRAYEKALEKGYQRIGFVGSLASRRMFSAGYLRAQLDHTENILFPPLMVDIEQVDQNRILLAGWMKKYKPDAILTDNLLLISLLKELGYSIPGDVGLATMSMHDTTIDTGIDQNPEEIGRAAIRTLVSLLNEHHFGVPPIRNAMHVEGKWVDGSMLPSRL
ncbi:LacI family DNA-binding transcriptional regulator [Pontiellaceae bacterium B1224]|nr:LacI family DNA-binding transcriptional regulator [Pontiellaceae bacterium B1224]